MKYRLLLSFFGLYALSLISFAQTGPAGVGSSTNNIGWFRSTSGVFNDAGSSTAGNNDLVQQWSDASGNGFAVSQADSISRPTFETNQINGFPAVNFDGTDDFMQGSIGGGTTNTASVFCVGSYDQVNQGANDHDYFYSIGSSWSTSLNHGRGASNFQGGAGADEYYAWVMGNIRAGTTTLLSSGYDIHSQRFNNASPFHNFRVGGVTQSVQDVGSAISINEQLRLGALRNSAVTHPLNGDITELIIYNSFVGLASTKIIENYLAAKYNLAVGDDLYAFDGTHPNEVAGIGQESATDNNTDAQGTAIVRINGADDLQNSEYLIWGHDGASLTGDGTEVPASFPASGEKLNREWVADISNGDVGTVDITFDMAGINIGADPNNFRILTDTDGTFTNANENAGIVPVINGDLITFNNVDLFTNGNFFTIANTGEVTDCIAFFSTTWQTDIAWTCNPHPDSTNNAIIDPGVTTTVASDESVNDLTVNGTLALNAGVTLVVNGDVTVASGGSITADPTSTIIFRSVSGSTKSITTPGASTTTFGNVIISNPNNVRFLGGAYEIAGGLSLNRGLYQNTTSLTFTSDATSQGHIKNVGATGGFTGSVFTMQRFMSGRPANWNGIATTGIATNIADIDNEIFISGVPGADGYAASSGGGGFISMWRYDNSTQQYVPVSHVSELMPVGRGYEVWLADNLNNWNSKAWDFTGTSFNLSSTDIPINGNGDGWNLVGNPLPGFLDFGPIAAENLAIIGSQFWYYDADSSTYNHRGTNASIPPGQGFWLNVAGSFTLSIDPSHLKDDINTSNFYKQPVEEGLEEMKVEVQSDESVFGSAVFLRKDNSSFEGADQRDLPLLSVPDPRAVNLWMDYSSTKSMLNYINPDKLHIEIPLTVESGTPGKYEMKFKGTRHFKDYQCMNIVNEQTGEQIEITPGSPYTFTITEDLSPLNFTLLMSKEDYVDCLAKEENFTNNDIKVYSDGSVIMADFYLDRKAEANITIHNMLGETIYNQPAMVGYSRETIQLDNAQAGVYFITIDINGESTTEKVFLK